MTRTKLYLVGIRFNINLQTKISQKKKKPSNKNIKFKLNLFKPHHMVEALIEFDHY